MKKKRQKSLSLKDKKLAFKKKSFRCNKAISMSYHLIFNSIFGTKMYSYDK